MGCNRMPENPHSSEENLKITAVGLEFSAGESGSSFKFSIAPIPVDLRSFEGSEYMSA